MLFERLFRTARPTLTRSRKAPTTVVASKHRRRTRHLHKTGHLESLEPRQLLAFTYQGITHTCVTPLPQQQNYQYNFKIFQQSPTDTATTMYLRNVANTGDLEFDYTTNFSGLQDLGRGIGSQWWFDTSLPPITYPGTEGPSKIWNSYNFNSKICSPDTEENYSLAKVRIYAAPGTVDPTFVLHVGDNFPLALEVDFSQAVGTSRIIINSAANQTFDRDVHTNRLPNGGGWYTFLADEIYIQAPLDPRNYGNDFRAESLVEIKNSVQNGVISRVSNGNFVIGPNASVSGSSNIETGAAVPPTSLSPFSTYGYGGNGGDIIVNGQINSAATVYLQTNSTDPRNIVTGPGGLISGGNSITLYNSAGDGGSIDVRTAGFGQHNIFAGSSTNPEADIAISVTQVSGNLTINALPSTRAALRLATTGSGSQVITNTNLDTYGSLSISAPNLNINRPISTRFGDISLSGSTVTIGSDISAGNNGIGSLLVESTAGDIVVQSAATLSASGETISFKASSDIISQATLVAERLDLIAGDTISASSRVDTITATAGGTITIAEESGIAVESISTTSAGDISISAQGLVEIYDISTGGTGNVTVTTTSAGMLARDINATDGSVSLLVADGDINAVGDVFVNDPSSVGHDFTLTASRGNIVMSPGATFTVADQLAFDAPLGRVLTPGQIDAITVTNVGSGYTSTPDVEILSGADAIYSPLIGDNQVTRIQVLNGGSGYTAAPSVVLDNAGTGGTGATAVAEVAGGAVVSIRIQNGGSGYTTAPKISFVGGGGGGGAAAVASVSGLTALIPVITGSDYQVPPQVVISSGEGSSAAAIEVDRTGRISSINLSQPGSAFVGVPSVVITDTSGSGAGASAVATLSPGVTGGLVSLGGSGYSATTTASVDPPASGTQATGEVVLGLTNNSVAAVSNGGDGYRVGDLLEVIAGSGAQFQVTSTSGGAVNSVAMLSPGRNYSVGDVLYLNDSPLQASGLEITITAVRADGVIDASGFLVTNAGVGYNLSSVLTHIGGSGGILRVAAVSGSSTTPLPGPITSVELWDSDGAGAVRRGQGYTTRPSAVSGGSGSGVRLTFTDTEYTVVGYRVVEPGSGYSAPPKITLSNSTGLPASILPVVSEVVSGISVTSSGTAYNPATTEVAILPAAQGGGASAEAVSVNGVGGITGINIASPGFGYVAPPTISIIDQSGVGTGARAEAKLSEGVTGITLHDSGVGYTSAPKVTIIGTGGFGTGAEAVAEVSAAGYITSVRVTNPGVGYTSGATIVFSGGGGTGATATATTSSVVSSISMTSSGVGYDPAKTIVQINPVGSGAEAVANIAGGTVTSLRILDNGSGYSTATPPTVRIIPYGLGGIATADLCACGEITGVTVTAAGANYAVAPTIEIAPPTAGGTQAQAEATIGSVAQLSANRLNWRALEQPLNALLDQFAIASIELTGAGPLNITRTSGELVLEGAVTKDGPISVAAQKLTVTGPVIAGDFDTSRTENVTLAAIGSDLLIDAAVTAPNTITLEANAGEITSSSIASRGLLTSQHLQLSALDGIAIRSKVATISGLTTGSNANIIIDETDDVTIGGTDGPLSANKGTITATVGGTLTIGRIDAGSTGQIQLTSKSNLIPAASSSSPNIVAGTASLTSTLGRVEMTTDVSTLSASSPGVTVDITNSGGNPLTLRSLSARNDVNVKTDGLLVVGDVTSTLTNVTLVTTSADIRVDRVQAAKGVVSLDSPGQVTWVDPVGVLPNVTATTTRIAATEEISLRTDVGTLAAATAGAITINELDDISLGEVGGPPGLQRVESTAGAIAVTAAGSITAVDVRAPSSNVALTSTAAGILAGLLEVNATAGIARLTAATSITDNDTFTDITGFAAVLVSQTGTVGSATDAIDTAVDEVSATAQGDVYVKNARNLITHELVSVGGDVSIEAAGTILLDDRRAGSVANVTILDGGSGYTFAPVVSFSDPTEPNGVTATGNAVLAFSVNAVTVTSQGSGYTTPPSVAFSPPDIPGGQATTGVATVDASGRVTAVTITEVGSGYTAPPTVSFTDPAAGTTATATATLATTGVVGQINLTDAGTGYLQAPSVIIAPPPNGVPATASANLDNDPLDRSVSAAVITSSGSGYESIPAVTFSPPTQPDGKTAQGIAAVNFGVGSVTITEGGSGYNTLPLVTFSAPSTPGGSTALGIATLVNGIVTQITVTDPGSGYTTIPTITISPSPAGTSATAEANLTGEVTSITITDPGSGYVTPPSVTIAPSPTGDTATAKAVLNIGAVVAYASVGSVAVRSGGTGYSTVPSVIFSAPEIPSGRTAAGFATLDQLGRVSSITVTDPGSGYLKTPTLTIAPSPGGATAQADAILTGGSVILKGGGDIRQNVPITSIAVSASATAGTIQLDNIENDTANLSLSNPGRFVKFVDTNHVTISGSGIVAGESSGGTAVDVLADTITVAAPVVAGTAATQSDGNILLTASRGDILVDANLTAQLDTITLRADEGTIVQTSGVIDSLILVWYAQSQPVLLNTNKFSIVGPNLTSPGDMRIPSSGSHAGTLTIAAASTVDGSITVDADSVILIDVMKAGGSGHDVTITARAGDIIFQQDGRIVNAGGDVSLTAADGAVTALNMANWTTVTAGSITGGALSLDARDNSALLTDVATVEATVTSGDLDLAAAGPLAIKSVDAQAVVLLASGDVTQLGPIKGTSLIVTTSGPVSLTDSTNDVDTLSGSSGLNPFLFTDADDLSIAGTGIVGFNALGGTGVGVTAGSLKVNAPVTAGTAGQGNGNVYLTSSTGDLLINSNVTAADDRITLEARNGNITQALGSVLDSRILVWFAESAPNFNTTAIIEGPNLTAPGDMLITRPGPLVLAGASTVDGSITVSASDVTIIDLVNAGGLAHPVSITATGGDIVFDEVGRVLNTGGDVTLTANSGNVTALNASTSTTVTAGSVANGLLMLRANGSSVVSTDVASLDAVITSGSLTLTGPAGLSIQKLEATQISITAAGDILQTGPITTPTLGIANSAGVVNLANSANDVDTVTISNGNRSVSFRDQDSLEVGGAGIQGASITIVAGGLSQAGTISGSSLAVTNTAGAVVLANPANNVQAVSIANPGRPVAYADADAVSISTGGIHGSSIVLQAGGVSQTGSITGSNLAVTNTSGSVLLGNSGNNVAMVTISNPGRSITYSDADALNIGNAGIQGSTISLNAGGLTQSGSIYGTSLEVTNTSGGVALSNISNDIDSVSISNPGRATAFTDTDGFTVAQKGITSGTVRLQSGGNLQQVGAIKATALAVANQLVAGTVSGDFNNDGISDLAGRDAEGRWWVGLANNTDTTLAYSIFGIWNPTAVWLDVMAADVNGDGIDDVVSRTSGGIWWAGISNGTSFTNQRMGTQQWAPIAWADVMSGDFNGDGRDDVIGRAPSGAWWAGISVPGASGPQFINRYMGSWNPNAGWQDVMTADFTGDGISDLIGRTSSGYWWLGVPNATGTSISNRRMGQWSPTTWLDVNSGDFNGDGRADVVGRTESGQWWTSLTNLSATSFSTSRWGNPWNPAVNWTNVMVGDYDNNGLDDIAGQVDYGSTWWSANSTGSTFVTTQRNWSTASVWGSGAVFNQSGRSFTAAGSFGGVVALTNATNDVDQLAIDSGGRDAAFRDLDGVSVGVGSLGIQAGDVALTTGAALTQTQPIFATALSANVAGGGATLTNAANQFGVLSAALTQPGAGLTVDHNGTLAVDQVNTAGNVTIRTSNGGDLVIGPAVTPAPLLQTTTAVNLSGLTGSLQFANGGRIVAPGGVTLPAGARAEYVVSRPNASTGEGSLFAVMEDINAAGIPAEIVIPANATIQLTAALPAMTTSFRLQATNLVLDGSLLGSTSKGLSILAGASSSIVSGVSFRNFQGVGVDLVSTTNSLISGNTFLNSNVGLQATGVLNGTQVLGNQFSGNPTGISLTTAQGLRVGSSTTASRNTVSNASREAVFATGICTGSVVQGMIFGSNVAREYNVSTSRNLQIIP